MIKFLIPEHVQVMMVVCSFLANLKTTVFYSEVMDLLQKLMRQNPTAS